MWLNVEHILIDDAVDQYLLLVFMPMADILNILCKYQFAFSIIHELDVSHRA